MRAAVHSATAQGDVVMEVASPDPTPRKESRETEQRAVGTPAEALVSPLVRPRGSRELPGGSLCPVSPLRRPPLAAGLVAVLPQTMPPGRARVVFWASREHLPRPPTSQPVTRPRSAAPHHVFAFGGPSCNRGLSIRSGSGRSPTRTACVPSAGVSPRPRACLHTSAARSMGATPSVVPRYFPTKLQTSVGVGTRPPRGPMA